MEIQFKETIAKNILVECHTKNEYVLLAVYVTGHGYMDKDLRSQILLNQRIHFNHSTLEADVEKATTFFNPYPVEKMLFEMYEKFPNVFIVLIADICREPNKFMFTLNNPMKKLKDDSRVIVQEEKNAIKNFIQQEENKDKLDPQNLKIH